MKQAGIAFEEQVVFYKASLQGRHFAGLSPTGQLPLLVDGDVQVWDSQAITEYLAETFDHIWPQDRIRRAWARSAAAEMHSGFTALRSVYGMNCGLRVALRAPHAAADADWRRIEAIIGEGIDRFGGPFLAGDTFTAVDAFYCPIAFRVQTYGVTLSNPVASRYLTALLALPAMQHWHAAALDERSRHDEYDAEALKFGDITADLRAPVEAH
ncbi:glutathione S-transferase [Devosia sp. MSA67]|uniref:Glutathione S-transferase n=2 Tax=Devosia sediminis TaxID=2798801 RepID=A0A934MRD1_9HYPH|nr:glutathione S-transferase [Devosia sediminis]